MDRVEEILKKDGPMLSGALANRLERKYAISNTAARKVYIPLQMNHLHGLCEPASRRM